MMLVAAELLRAAAPFALLMLAVAGQLSIMAMVLLGFVVQATMIVFSPLRNLRALPAGVH